MPTSCADVRETFEHQLAPLSSSTINLHPVQLDRMNRRRPGGRVTARRVKRFVASSHQLVVVRVGHYKSSQAAGRATRSALCLAIAAVQPAP